MNRLREDARYEGSTEGREGMYTMGPEPRTAPGA